MIQQLPPGKKKCPKCKDVKDIDDFAKRKDTIDGREGYCKVCRHEITNESARKRKENRKQFKDMYF